MRLLHADATAHELEIFRRFVFLLWIAKYLTHPFEEIAVLPPAWANLVGVVRWLPTPLLTGLFDESVLLAARLLILVGCAACLIPRSFRVCAPGVCLLVTFEQSLNRSFGHTAHAEVCLLVVTYLVTGLAFADRYWVRRPASGRRDFNPCAVPMVMATLVLCLTYALVGIARLTRDPLELFAGDTIIYAIIENSSRPWLLDFDLWRRVSDWPWAIAMIKLGFPLVTIVEVLAPLCLISRGFRVVFLATLIPFHVAVILLMEIAFLENLMLFVLLVDWSSRRAPRGRR